MASSTWWAWVRASSGSWWWIGKPGVLQCMVSQRVGHECMTEVKDVYIKKKKKTIFFKCHSILSDFKSTQIVPIPALSSNTFDVSPLLPRKKSRSQKLSLLGLEEKIKYNHFILKLKPLKGKHLPKIPEEIGVELVLECKLPDILAYIHNWYNMRYSRISMHLKMTTPGVWNSYTMFFYNPYSVSNWHS